MSLRAVDRIAIEGVGEAATSSWSAEFPEILVLYTANSKTLFYYFMDGRPKPLKRILSIEDEPAVAGLPYLFTRPTTDPATGETSGLAIYLESQYCVIDDTHYFPMCEHDPQFPRAVMVDTGADGERISFAIGTSSGARAAPSTSPQRTTPAPCPAARC